MTKQSSSSCTFAYMVSNEDLEYCDIELNKQISINDVIAVKNPLCKFMNEDVSPFDVSILCLAFFKIGKVNDIKENDITITLFNYKLHTRSEHIIEHDVLFNYGNIGSKTMFELADEKQNILINRIFELGRLFFSLTTNDVHFFSRS